MFFPQLFLQAKVYDTKDGAMITIEDATRIANQELNRYLEGLPVLYGTSECPYGWMAYEVSEKLPHGTTHTCKAWGITPIQPEKVETAEDLLREFVNRAHALKITDTADELFERAKALLSKADK